jgi:hypothetical protein
VSAAALERALADAGLGCTVEARDRLALLVAPGDAAAALAAPEGRRTALALATAHGFTHVALEVRPDDPTPGGRAPLPRA